MKRLALIFLFIILVLWQYACLGQSSVSINIFAKEKPLKELCFELGRSHNIQFSFNDKLVQSCLVTKNEQYSSIQEALDDILKDCDLQFKFVNDVILIQERALNTLPQNTSPKKYFVRAEIVDQINGEALPFASVKVQNLNMISNQNGYFSALTEKLSSRIQISYIGYEPLDTIIPYSQGIQRIQLKPSATQLKEVVISVNEQEPHEREDLIIPKMSTKGGLIKLNNQLAQLLPGGADNTLFNLTRLQPGILAAGEQTNEFTVWGSYKGQTQVIFDGINLFQLGSRNPQIGIINPLIIKDIEIHKGGYNVGIGNRVGGVINITGKNGSQRRDKDYEGVFKITNETVSGLLKIPLKSGAVQLGTRKTHHFLNIGRIEGFNNVSFFDYNVKYDQKIGGNNMLTFSVLGNRQDFNDTKNEKGMNQYESTLTEFSNQLGASIQFDRRWNNIGNTNIALSYTNFGFDLYKSIKFKRPFMGNDLTELKTATNNEIEQKSLKVRHKFPSYKMHQWTLGLDYYNN
ncbi:MAG: carboxypeptidase-like regulatory domain-containing protein, partial [Flavobacteriales bacterium]|nr:carboxypeptidase-like regulatory domain-containing protein [Flavobacteriales bacterium]